MTAYYVLALVVALVSFYLLLDARQDRQRPAMSPARKELRRKLFRAILDNPRRENDVYAWLRKR
jgi:hypothetical protein